MWLLRYLAVTIIIGLPILDDYATLVCNYAGLSLYAEKGSFGDDDAKSIHIAVYAAASFKKMREKQERKRSRLHEEAKAEAEETEKWRIAKGPCQAFCVWHFAGAIFVCHSLFYLIMIIIILLLYF